MQNILRSCFRKLHKLLQSLQSEKESEATQYFFEHVHRNCFPDEQETATVAQYDSEKRMKETELRKK